jgi:hypothetical protein
VSWEQLIDILSINEDDVAEFNMRTPAACPYDGYPLQPGPLGELDCPAGDYTWTG